MGVHKGHEALPIDQAYEEMKPQIEKCLEVIESKKNQRKQDIQKVDKLLEKIKKLEEETNSKLDDAKIKLFQQIDQYFTQKQNEIQQQAEIYIPKLKEQQDQIQKNIQLFKQLENPQQTATEKLYAYQIAKKVEKQLKQQPQQMEIYTSLTINSQEFRQKLANMIKFSIKAWNQNKITNIQRSSNIIPGYQIPGDCFDCVSFKSSSDIQLIGIGQLAPQIKNQDLSIRQCFVIQGRKTNDPIVYSHQKQQIVKNTADSPYQIYKLLFRKAVKIKANIIYTIKILLSGSDCYHFMQGSVSVIAQEQQLEIQFMDSQPGENEKMNKSNSKEGQIPILYIKC